MKNPIQSCRVQFITLSIATAVIASTTDLFAYLTDVTSPIEGRFQLQAKSSPGDFNVSISTMAYEENSTIVPGSIVSFDPYITNDGDYDSYVFIKIIVPDETFQIAHVNSKWELLENGSSEDNVLVYSYSSNGRLLTLPKAAYSRGLNTSSTPSLCEGILLDADTPLLDDEYVVTATGYAIQTEGFESESISEVWKAVSSSPSGPAPSNY